MSVDVLVVATVCTMLDLKASDVIALLALAVSAVAFARPMWSERKASIEVRSEEYRRVRGKMVVTEHRYVVKSHGPAQARDVAVTFYAGSERVELTLTGWNHRAETPLLHPGEEMHMTFFPPHGDPPDRVVVSWRDDRRFRRQSQEFYPSCREL